MPQFITGSGTLTGDGDSAVFDFPGGTGTVQANFASGTGTLTLFVSLDNGATFTSGGTTVQLTASGLFNFTLPPCKIRMNLAGSGGSPSIPFWISTPTND